jgi:hypothetical protein
MGARSGSLVQAPLKRIFQTTQTVGFRAAICAGAMVNYKFSLDKEKLWI